MGGMTGMSEAEMAKVRKLNSIVKWASMITTVIGVMGLVFVWLFYLS
jgi:hypothetical protein